MGIELYPEMFENLTMWLFKTWDNPNCVVLIWMKDSISIERVKVYTVIENKCKHIWFTLFDFHSKIILRSF